MAKQVFVGSSTEGKALAGTVIEALSEAGLSPMPWFDFFKSERPPLQELEQLTLRADAAVLVASADDKAIIRGKEWQQARDNVLFEYGLFAGTLGRPKCALVLPDLEDFRIPSDFLGVACFQTYGADEIDTAAKATVDSLKATLQKPQPEQTTQARGRRLLQFIGWIRDESLRLVRDWNNRSAREIVSGRIIAISGFIQEDIDRLALREEYDNVEQAVLDAIRDFPDLGGQVFQLQESEKLTEALVRGHFRPNREILGHLIYHLLRLDGRHVRFEDLRYEDLHFLFSRDEWNWPPYARWPHPPRWPDDSRPRSFDDALVRLGERTVAYTMGAAEVATVFLALNWSPIERLTAWSESFVPELNDAAAQFERKLHEQIFGKL